MTEAEQICHFGKIIYERGFAAANDGNISMRLPEGGFLCTATMQSKGWLQPDDLCVVDENGDQISGKRKRSSEIMLHLEVYRHRPDVNAVVHCHPPHATAFAIAREPIPQCILPEVEIFLGEVPTARYETPGSRAFSESIIPFVKESNVIVLANHGTLSFGRSMELAWWFTDILDAYCRALILAKQLGRIHRFDEGKCGELLEYKLKWGFSDLRNHGPRAGCRVCRHEAFRDTWESSGLRQVAFPDSDSSGASASSQSLSLSPATLDLIADAIVERLKGRV